MGSIMLNGISYTSGGADVEANPQDTPSDTLSTIGIDGVVYEIEGGGGGSDVVVDPTITSGTKIADITVDGDTSSLYAPEVSLTYAEYMALTEQEKNNGTTYYITDMDAGSINIFTPVIYSQQEREIGVWIDNKPLYAKTYPVTFTGSYVDISINSTHEIKMLDGGVDSLNNDNFIHIGYGASSNDMCGVYEYELGKLRFQNFYYQSRPNGWLTTFYTKTTDTAGSGSYNTLGVPMVHYSTDEQVIGTWIDGKTIYMRTFDFGSDIQVPYNTFISTTIDAVNKETIIDAFGIYSIGTTCYPLVGNINEGRIRLQACRDNQVALVQYVTIKYTKITD